MSPPRLLLRLPTRALRGASLERLARRAGVHPKPFRLSPAERRFALELAEPGRLWTWRCHQQRYCGDFAVVDMSEPRPDKRRAWLMELKGGRLLSPGLQLKNSQAARASLVRSGVLGFGSRLVLLRGGPRVLLGELGL